MSGCARSPRLSSESYCDLLISGDLLVGLAGIEPATSALSGRSGNSRWVPLRLVSSQLPWSSTDGNGTERRVGTQTARDANVGTELGQFDGLSDRNAASQRAPSGRVLGRNDGLSDRNAEAQASSSTTQVTSRWSGNMPSCGLPALPVSALPSRITRWTPALARGSRSSTLRSVG